LTAWAPACYHAPMTTNRPTAGHKPPPETAAGNPAGAAEGSTRKGETVSKSTADRKAAAADQAAAASETAADLADLAAARKAAPAGGVAVRPDDLHTVADAIQAGDADRIAETVAAIAGRIRAAGDERLHTLRAGQALARIADAQADAELEAEHLAGTVGDASADS